MATHWAKAIALCAAKSVCQVRSEGVSYHAIEGHSPVLGMVLATQRYPLASDRRYLNLSLSRI